MFSLPFPVQTERCYKKKGNQSKVSTGLQVSKKKERKRGNEMRLLVRLERGRCMYSDGRGPSQDTLFFPLYLSLSLCGFPPADRPDVRCQSVASVVRVGKAGGSHDHPLCLLWATPSFLSFSFMTSLFLYMWYSIVAFWLYCTSPKSQEVKSSFPPFLAQSHVVLMNPSMVWYYCWACFYLGEFI